MQFALFSEMLQHGASLIHIIVTQNMASEVEERKYRIASLFLDHLLQTKFLWKGENTKLRGQENSPLFTGFSTWPCLAGPGPQSGSVILHSNWKSSASA